MCVCAHGCVSVYLSKLCVLCVHVGVLCEHLCVCVCVCVCVCTCPCVPERCDSAPRGRQDLTTRSLT